MQRAKTAGRGEALRKNWRRWGYREIRELPFLWSARDGRVIVEQYSGPLVTSKP